MAAGSSDFTATSTGDPANELTLLKAYDSLAHWEATRQDTAPPEGSSAKLMALYEANLGALRERAKLTVVSSSMVLRPISTWIDLAARPG